MMDVICHCGGSTPVQDDSVIGNEITECSVCGDELCFDEAFDDLMDSRELAASFFTNQ